MTPNDKGQKNNLKFQNLEETLFKIGQKWDQNKPIHWLQKVTALKWFPNDSLMAYLLNVWDRLRNCSFKTGPKSGTKLAPKPVTKLARNVFKIDQKSAYWSIIWYIHQKRSLKKYTLQLYYVKKNKIESTTALLNEKWNKKDY